MSAAKKLDAALPPMRYRIVELLSHRAGLTRYMADDESSHPSKRRHLVRERLPTESDESLPGDESAWPNLGWEDRLGSRCRHLGLPRIVDRFSDDEYAYLVYESPEGIPLWDAWDDVNYSPADKYGWLIELADLMQVLHSAGAIFESLRPDQVLLSPSGHIVLVDTSQLLPLPLPLNAPLAGTFATPPELLTGAWIDARSDLYCFGALVYALLLGRELADVDFLAPGIPKPYLERFPDAHPLIGRLLSKTLTPHMDWRFPTDNHGVIDLTGFQELIAVLEQCQETMNRARLELASWSNTGMSRSGNEDAFAVLRMSAGRQDALQDFALVIVADGMGGSAAGEVAAALAVRELYQALGTQPPFGRVANDEAADELQQQPTYGQRISDAIKQANRAVYLASRQGVGRRGMGCTAEAVFTDGRRLVIGHVGDSRTYLFRNGQLTQLTRDHTYVGTLLECGTITPKEAENHFRRSELQQAIGGWTDVEPQMIDVPLAPGDWVLVCSDGLSNLVKPEMVRGIFERATSADSAARQLVNLANLHGAPDNVTAAVIRAF